MAESSKNANATRVAHISSAHPWSDNRIHLREAASLAANGFDVTLVAVDNDLELPDTGVCVRRIRYRSRLNRVIIGSLSAVIEGLRSRASIVHLHDPELSWSIPIFRCLGKTVIYDAHEDLPDQMADKEYIPGFAQSSARLVAKSVVRFTALSHRVVAATERIAERYPVEKTVVVRNYPTLSAHSAPSPSDAMTASQNPSIVYVGAITAARGAEQMVMAMGDPRIPGHARLHLAGPASEAFIGELRDLPGWEKVVYHGVLAPPAARELIAKAEVGLVVLEGTNAYRESLPTKMFEYMAAGIPVIASDFALWRKIIEEHQCGVVVDERSPAEVATAILTYLEDDELRVLHGENGERAARSTLNWDREATTLVEMYRALIHR